MTEAYKGLTSESYFYIYKMRDFMAAEEEARLIIFTIASQMIAKPYRPAITYLSC